MKTIEAETSDRRESAELVRTLRWVAGRGSAIDPLVSEITWQAWELTAADPARLSQQMAERITIGFDCLVEAAWQPGRSLLITEAEHDGAALKVRLALGVFAEEGRSQAEASGQAAHVESMFGRQDVLSVCRIDPSLVVPFAGGAPATASAVEAGHVAHIRQRVWSLGDGTADVEVVSRFNPTFEPWSRAVEILHRLGRHVRIRATVLATETSPADRIEIEGALERVAAMRERNQARPHVKFDADRAESTLLDLRASLASPALVGELAIWSAEELPDSVLRSIATSFTSEADVLRRQGHVVVASSRLVLGGFEISRNPDGWLEGLTTGLPVRGGIGPRSVADLLTLAESPIGWPLPISGPVGSISTRVPVERETPETLVRACGSNTPLLGIDSKGNEVGIPLDLRTRHVLISGTWGTGKSTVLRSQALSDLEGDGPFLFLDPHGTAAEELAVASDLLGADAVVFDASDPETSSLLTLPPRNAGPYERDRAVRRVAEAIASSLPNEEWTGPRWFASFTALLEVVQLHEAELVDGMVWLNDPELLRSKIGRPGLSLAAKSTLLNLTSSTGEGADVRGWVSSKLNPLVGGSVRRLLSRAGEGVDLAEVLAQGRPVIANLASLTPTEGNLVGHLILATMLDAAFSRRPDQRSLFTCYVDEAHRFPAAGLTRAMAEGRKFGIGLMLAVQSLNQATRELADLGLGAGTHIVFRSTPDSAVQLAPVVQVPAHELITQPDLHAVVALQGQSSASVAVHRPASRL